MLPLRNTCTRTHVCVFAFIFTFTHSFCSVHFQSFPCPRTRCLIPLFMQIYSEIIWSYVDTLTPMPFQCKLVVKYMDCVYMVYTNTFICFRFNVQCAFFLHLHLFSVSLKLMRLYILALALSPFFHRFYVLAPKPSSLSVPSFYTHFSRVFQCKSDKCAWHEKGFMEGKEKRRK